MNHVIAVLAVLAAILGLLDFFIPKTVLESFYGRIRDQLSYLYDFHLDHQYPYSAIARIIDFVIEYLKTAAYALSGLCFFIALKGYFFEHTSLKQAGIVFALGVPVYLTVRFLAIPLIYILLLIVLLIIKLFVRYLIWSPKGVTAIITLPLAIWAVYTKFGELHWLRP